MEKTILYEIIKHWKHINHILKKIEIVIDEALAWGVDITPDKHDFFETFKYKQKKSIFDVWFFEGQNTLENLQKIYQKNNIPSEDWLKKWNLILKKFFVEENLSISKIALKQYILETQNEMAKFEQMK